MSYFIYDLLVILCFELSNNFTIRTTDYYQLIPIVVVVILTIRSGFRDCTSTLPVNRPRCSISVLVFSGTPLMKVVYRDGQPLTSTPPPAEN